MKRINDKIEEIGEFLEHLNQIAPASFEEYKDNIEKKAACERYAEKIIEALTDLSFLAIKFKKLKLPQDDIDAFNILSENKIIDDNLSVKLKNAEGMRNILAHQYGKVDDEIVFDSIKEELEKDALDLIKSVKNILR